MIPKVRWWRVKPSGTLGTPAAWFDARLTYPGFVVHDARCDENVRVFRDLPAFTAHDGSFSIDLPLRSVDEVSEPA
jgi:hypothetical protein